MKLDNIDRQNSQLEKTYLLDSMIQPDMIAETQASYNTYQRDSH
jgi:ribosomal protein S19